MEAKRKGVAVMLGIFLGVTMVYSEHRDSPRLRPIIPPNADYIFFEPNGVSEVVNINNSTEDVVWKSKSGHNFSVKKSLNRDYADHVTSKLRNTFIVGPTLGMSSYSAPSLNDVDIWFLTEHPQEYSHWQKGIPRGQISTTFKDSHNRRRYDFIGLAFDQAIRMIKVVWNKEEILAKLPSLGNVPLWVHKEDGVLSTYTFAFNKYSTSASGDFKFGGLSVKQTAKVTMEVRPVYGLAYCKALEKMARDSWAHLKAHYPHYLRNGYINKIRFVWDLLKIDIEVTSSRKWLPRGKLTKRTSKSIGHRTRYKHHAKASIGFRRRKVVN